MYIPENDAILNEVIAAYDFPETLMGAVRYGSGHINDTFCLVCQPQEGNAIRFILQGLSVAAFPRQAELMENFIGVTSHLRKKIEAAGGDVMRETLNLVNIRDGKPYYVDSTGKTWRLMPYVEGTVCLQKATPELFEASARAFGRFQRLLADYPAHTLHESIVNFHTHSISHYFSVKNQPGDVTEPFFIIWHIRRFIIGILLYKSPFHLRHNEYGFKNF